jgi:hypothetical protein
MKKSGSQETPSIQSLGRGLSILEAVADVPLSRYTATGRRVSSAARKISASLRL